MKAPSGVGALSTLITVIAPKSPLFIISIATEAKYKNW